MVDLLEQLFSVIWQEEISPRQWREGLIVNIFKKGDREDPANYRGITLLSVVGKVFCKILNNRLIQCLDKEGALSWVKTIILTVYNFAPTQRSLTIILKTSVLLF